MAQSTVLLIVFFSALMIAVSFLIGVWSKKKVTTAQAYFGGTAMFGPVAVGLSSMAGIASAFALVGVPGIIYTSGNAMTFWMLSGAAFATSYIILGKRVRAMAEIAPISSLGDICDIRFNHNRIIKALMSIIICLGCVGYLAAQISAGSTLIAQLVDIPPIVAGFIIFGLLTVYTALSGEVGGLLSQAFQGLVMVVAGDGPYLKELMEFELPNTVFTGFLGREELSSVYASCDAFVFPSGTETFGNVVLEAMASGLPVVCANSGGVTDFVSHLDNAYLFGNRHIMGLAQAMSLMLSSPALRENLKRGGLQTARDRSWNGVFDVLMTQYERVRAEERSGAGALATSRKLA